MKILGAPPSARRFASVVKPSPSPVAAAPASRWSFEWIYFSLIIAAWCFTPFIRRLIDYHNGAVNPVSVTSLIPYAMLMPLAVICLRPERIARLARPFKLLLWTWLAVFGYGFLIGFANGNTGAAGFELVEYLLPPLAGIWIAGQDVPVVTALRRFAFVMLGFAGVVATYGFVQWIDPPAWDVLWVVGTEFITAGNPEPFGLRLFSTLNSPGTAGDFFALTMLIALPWLRLRSVWVWPLLSALGAALMLTLVREAWIGLVLGIAVFLIASPRRLSTAPLLLAYAVLMVFLAIALPPLLGSRNSDVISSRVSSLTELSHDDSALARQTEISEALDQGLSNPIGSGLGVFGSAAKLGPNPTLAVGNILDSGYLARLIELGWLGTIAYCAVVICGPFVLTFKLFGRKYNASPEVKIAGALILAVCLFLVWGDAADDAHYGLDGFFFWIALGLGSLAQQSITEAAVPGVRGGLAQAAS